VPLIKDQLIGVLDLDSTSLEAFDAADATGLNQLVSILIRKTTEFIQQ
jgi:putative methionine-R-sulfoxide reductase with GAF domain